MDHQLYRWSPFVLQPRIATVTSSCITLICPATIHGPSVTSLCVSIENDIRIWTRMVTDESIQILVLLGLFFSCPLNGVPTLLWQVRKNLMFSWRGQSEIANHRDYLHLDNLAPFQLSRRSLAPFAHRQSSLTSMPPAENKQPNAVSRYLGQSNWEQP